MTAACTTMPVINHRLAYSKSAAAAAVAAAAVVAADINQFEHMKK